MTAQKNDGGPACPTLDGRDGPNGPEYFSHDGLSKRDWFAGQALANPKICGDGSAWEVDALTAYAAADAMLKAREKGGSDGGRKEQ